MAVCALAPGVTIWFREVSLTFCCLTDGFPWVLSCLHKPGVADPSSVKPEPGPRYTLHSLEPMLGYS